MPLLYHGHIFSSCVSRMNEWVNTHWCFIFSDCFTKWVRDQRTQNWTMPFQPRNVSYCNKPLTEQRRPERLKDQGRGENTSGHQTILPLIGPVLECANTYKMVMKCELSASCASKKPFLCVFGGENNIYPTSDSDLHHL